MVGHVQPDGVPVYIMPQHRLSHPPRELRLYRFEDSNAQPLLGDGYDTYRRIVALGQRSVLDQLAGGNENLAE